MARLLLLEDEVIIQNFCKRLLEKEGYTLDIASNIAQARGLLGQNDYSLLVTDLRLPDGHGIDIIRAYRQKYPKRKALIITGSPGMLSQIPAEDMKHLDYLMKPFSGEDFLRLVKQLSAG